MMAVVLEQLEHGSGSDGAGCSAKSRRAVDGGEGPMVMMMRMMMYAAKLACPVSVMWTGRARLGMLTAVAESDSRCARRVRAAERGEREGGARRGREGVVEEVQEWWPSAEWVPRSRADWVVVACNLVAKSGSTVARRRWRRNSNSRGTV
jgi:hypothetical protein